MGSCSRCLSLDTANPSCTFSIMVKWYYSRVTGAMILFRLNFLLLCDLVTLMNDGELYGHSVECVTSSMHRIYNSFSMAQCILYLPEFTSTYVDDFLNTCILEDVMFFCTALMFEYEVLHNAAP